MARLRPNAPMPNNWLRISSVKPITLTSNNCNLSATTVVNMKSHVHSELTEPKKRFVWHSRHYANATQIVLLDTSLFRTQNLPSKALNSALLFRTVWQVAFRTLLGAKSAPCKKQDRSHQPRNRAPALIGGSDNALRGHEHLDHGDVRSQRGIFYQRYECIE